MSYCFDSSNHCNSLTSLFQCKPLRIIWKPPFPSSYSIIEKKITNKRGPLYIKCNFIPLSYNINPYPWITLECYQLTKIASKAKIILLHISNLSQSHQANLSKSTFIVSHSHTTDLGVDLPFLIDLCTMLQRDVVAYDYTGYGSSEGVSKQEECYSDIDQVMDFCAVNLNVKVDRMILIGIDAGAIPSLYIASKGDYCGIRGMVMISPFVIDDDKLEMIREDNCLDFDGDGDMLGIAAEVLCSVMLIHGKKDDVPWSQSEVLRKYFTYCTVWFPSLGSYYNLTSDYRSDFYRKVRKFAYDLERSDNKRIVQFNRFEESMQNSFNFDTIIKD